MTDLYFRSQIRGGLSRLWTWLKGGSNNLLDLADIEAHRLVQTRHYGQEELVSISQIRGSQGRCYEFDANFNLRQITRKQQWINLAVAWLREVPLPPVELIQIGDIYFVRDGHLRISVARTLGQEMILARVTVWQVAESLARPASSRVDLRKLVTTPPVPNLGYPDRRKDGGSSQ
ncbi:MAG: hypothetical protein AB1801_11050, partial [Chloroflexota bacterium]